MRAMSKLIDTLITNKSIYPMWVFTDVLNGKFIGKKFVCFIGANWPYGLVSGEEKHKEAVQQLKDGRWLTEMRLKPENKDKKIGWGTGDTPSLAFREAAYMSGHMTRVQT